MKEYRSNMCNAFWNMWQRKYEEIKCLRVAWMVEKELREQCKVQKKAVILEGMDPAKMLEKIWNLVFQTELKCQPGSLCANTRQTMWRCSQKMASTLAQLQVPPPWLHLSEYHQAVYNKKKSIAGFDWNTPDIHHIWILKTFGSLKIKVHLERMICSGH